MYFWMALIFAIANAEKLSEWDVISSYKTTKKKNIEREKEAKWPQIIASFFIRCWYRKSSWSLTLSLMSGRSMSFFSDLLWCAEITAFFPKQAHFRCLQFKYICAWPGWGGAGSAHFWAWCNFLRFNSLWVPVRPCFPCWCLMCSKHLGKSLHGSQGGNVAWQHQMGIWCLLHLRWDGRRK